MILFTFVILTFKIFFSIGFPIIPNFSTNQHQPNPEETGPYFEGDIINGEELLRSPKVVKDSKYLWPGGRVPYEIDTDTLSSTYRSYIAEAIKKFKDNTCIEFVPRNGDFNYVLFKGGSGCSSNVGMVGGGQSITLASACFNKPGTVLHEMMHALGFWHEHSRFDRDNYVSILWKNIVSAAYYSNFNKHTLVATQEISPYDYGSVLHYSRYGFSGGGETIKPLVNSVEIGQRNGFSEVDLFELRRLYSCEGYDFGTYPDTVKPANPSTVYESLPISCNFLDGYCGFYQELRSEKADWQRYIGGTPSFGTGPLRDHTDGSSVYSYIEASLPAVPGHVAKMFSPKFIASQSYCVKFAYNMYGEGIGSLRLYEHSNDRKKTIWEVSGNQGQEWKETTVILKGTSNDTRPAQIEFEGTIGRTYQSDIAIDDVSIYQCNPETGSNTDTGTGSGSSTEQGLSIEWIIALSVTIPVVVIGIVLAFLFGFNVIPI